MVLPCCTAVIMVLMLSSSSTTSATERATSEPILPMATPTSAALSAGPSLMPSPVIATTRPEACRAWTILTLWAGLTRANTVVFLTMFFKISGSSFSRLEESTISSGLLPLRRKRWPTENAVALWSPVIMTVSMPASWNWSMSSATPERRVSSIPVSPTQTKSVGAIPSSIRVSAYP